MERSDLALRAQNINVWYGEFQALKDVDLDVKPKSVTALIGPSGCGKSTFLRCFNRMNDLIPNTRVEGKILFKNKDINSPDVDPTEIRSRVGMVFQKANPFPKSVFDNVAFGLRINGYQGSMDEAVENSLKRAALWDEVKNTLGKGALTLSGGQQQRVGIARALAKNPSILLADEPTGNLDSQSSEEIMYMLNSLNENDGMTVIIVTHDLEIAKHTRRIISVRDGLIVSNERV